MSVPVITYTVEELHRAPDLPVDTIPVFDVGGEEEGEGRSFYRVRAAIGKPDGGMVVADDEGTVLRAYDARGRYLGSAGRRGEGPGEYGETAALGWLDGDSLVVVDLRNRRVSVLDDSLRFARSIPLPQGLHLIPTSGAPWLFVLEPFSFLWLESDHFGRRVVSPPSVPRIVHHSVALRRLRPGADGWAMDTIFRAAGATLSVRMGDHSVAAGMLRFGSRPVLGANRRGFVFAHTSRFELRQYDAGGSPVRVVRVHAPPRPVTEAERNELRGRIDPDRRDRLVFAEMHPVIQAMWVDAGGNIWVHPEDDVARGRGFVVFDRSGAVCGWYPSSDAMTLAPLPRTWDLYHGDGYVLTRPRDALGVEHVVKYRLPRCPSGGR